MSILGIVGAPLVGGSSGGGGDATLANQLAILAKLNPFRANVISPVAADGAIEIIAGDDYFNADGRALSWTVANYTGPAVTGLTVTFSATPSIAYQAGIGSATLSVSGSASMAGPDAVFKVELTASQTSSLLPTPPAEPYAYIYQLRARTGAGHVITEVLSSLTCKAKAS